MNWQPIATRPTRGAFLVWIPSTKLPWPAYMDHGVLRSNTHGVLNKQSDLDGRVLLATHWLPIEPPADTEVKL